MSGRLTIVGVGPGDPGLLTLKAARIVAEADVLAYPATERGSFAANIVADHVGRATTRLPFRVPMTGDGAAEAAYDEAARRIGDLLAAGRSVVLLCEGDPMLYGSAASIMDRVAADYPVTVVPGVTAASAAAAATSTSLARKDAPFAIVPASAPTASIASALRDDGGVVLYKVGRHFDEVARRIREAGRSGTLVVRATLADETVTPLAAAEPGPKPYFSLVIVPPRERRAEPATGETDAVAIIVLGPSALPAALTAQAALEAAGLSAEIHGRAERVTADAVTRVFTGVETHARDLFRAGRPIVGLMSTGILVRVLAPVLGSKRQDPPVVAMAEDGSAVVPLLGAHPKGRRIAQTIGAAFGTRPAHTTLSEVRLGIAFEEPPEGFAIADPAPFKTLAADLGEGIGIDPDPSLAFLSHLPRGPSRVRATVRREADAGTVPTYVREGLVLGMGAERGADPAAAVALAGTVLAEAGADPRAVAVVASLDVKADEAAIAAVASRLGAAFRLFDAATLAREEHRLETPSETVRAAVGVAGVAEAAALAAAGRGARLVVAKRVGERVTAALAEAPGVVSRSVGRARGHLAVVGTGPGAHRWRTPECVNLVAAADDLVGYSLYLDLVEDLRTHQERHDFDLGDETARVRFALERAGEGRTVALVSSGDPGIYAMATLAAELLDTGDISDAARRVALTVAPGVSAAQAAAARVGAPLGHDFAFVSLSDLLTPWEVIERRIHAAAAGDFAVAFYNPRSRRRTTQIERAMAILSQSRPASTPVVIAGSVGRPAETIVHTTLGDFDPEAVDMLATVIVGASTTRRLVRGDGTALVYTPRGYEVSS